MEVVRAPGPFLGFCIQTPTHELGAVEAMMCANAMTGSSRVMGGGGGWLSSCSLHLGVFGVCITAHLWFVLIMHLPRRTSQVHLHSLKCMCRYAQAGGAAAQAPRRPHNVVHGIWWCLHWIFSAGVHACVWQSLLQFPYHLVCKQCTAGLQQCLCHNITLVMAFMDCMPVAAA